MSYRYQLEDLLYLLYPAAPAIVDAISTNRRRVEHGLLSVGLKIHCLNDGAQFNEIVSELGGAQNILEVNRYKNQYASLCWVLPPVGNARTAIQLLEAIELATKSNIFNNDDIQIQVCSPNRLAPRYAALLAIAFYLGSDVLRLYTLGDFATTFSKFHHASKYDRGKRLVLYDAAGDFDKDFKWWGLPFHGRPFVLTQLPFDNGRTDILTAKSKLDIQNINLVASLFCHLEEDGFWFQFGMQFEKDIRSLLKRHQLEHIPGAPWVRSEHSPKDALVEHGDDAFMLAMQELMSYTLEDVIRVNRLGKHYFSEKTPDGPMGILWDMKTLLQKYRAKILEKSNLLQRGKKDGEVHDTGASA